MTAPPLVGREEELARIDAVLAGARAGGAGLVVRGARGCGMSALLDEAAARARGRGMRVVRAAGVEAEAGFAYAGLHQLVRPLRRGAQALAPAQQAALEAVLAGADRPLDRFATGLATLALLTGAAADGPVLVCVDEAQWLDLETLDAIAFVARRAAAAPVVLVAGAHAAEPLADPGLPELELGPLPPSSGGALLDAVAGRLDPFTRARLLEEAEGSPLALVELPAALDGGDEGALLSPWAALTPRLADTFGGGLERLPAATRVLLGAAAADPGAELTGVLAVGAALGATVADGAAALEPAVDVGLVTLDGGRVRFARRLTRAAVYRATTVTDRARLHRAWAQVAGARDPDRALWHRASAPVGADERLAAELEAAGRRTGAGTDALCALRRAAHLTPAGPVRDARLVAAAELACEAGAMAAADALLADVVPERLDRPARARLAAVTERLAPSPRADGGRARVLAAHARDAAQAGERRLALTLLHDAAAAVVGPDADADAALVLAAAREAAGEERAPALAAILAALDPHAHAAEILDAVGAGAAADAGSADDALLLGQAALAAGDPHAAAELLARAIADARDERRLAPLAQTLALSAWAHAATGALDAAARDAAAAERLCAGTRQPGWGAVAAAVLGLVAALRGDAEAAEEHAAAAERVALPARAAPVLALVQQVRATSALAAGRPGEAFAHLARLFDPLDPACDRPAAAALAGELAAAATTAEERATAAALLAPLPPPAAPRPRVAAACARALLADDDAADAAFAEAWEQTTGRWPLDEARVLLADGMRLRRERRVAESRAPLRAAHQHFVALGAAPWAERAARELAATTETAHRGANDADRLTPQERQIARMAADGLTNRQIADRLSLSPRTVGAHLSHVYPKLGVGSRGELAAALDGRTPAPARGLR